ncbi:hypothetical protein A9Q99_23985 [Gammaproteobacteria bacterium 45_16_T64]|mgnify:CR=1 FL=1|nr:hypothetical protein A9Q99_23985 [Gammaproteobacteria bacterium 45_16_T64]
MKTVQEYDYIIVGGGSSGCVVAARLAEQHAGSIVLLETGDATDRNPETMQADGFTDAFANDNVMWDRLSAPQQDCRKRSLYLGSGTGMGGSGSVNGMVYTRGDKRDYDQWPSGWKWKDIAPFFTEVETRLKVKPRAPTEYTETCIEAAKNAGFQQKDGLLDGDLCGFLGYQTMNYDGDQRRSSYMSFVRGQSLDNLTQITNARATRILFENKKAVGVEYIEKGIRSTLRARKEVILCAGALETPKLLMLSGVGPNDQLAEFGIPEVLHVPSIGQNLQDHPNVCVFYKGRKGSDCFYPQLYGFHRVNAQLPLPEDQADTCYVFYSAGSSLKASLKRMLPAVLLPKSVFYSPRLRRWLRKAVDLVYGITPIANMLATIYGVVVILGKPQSRGELRLASADPAIQAHIDPAYFTHPDDMETMIAGVEKAKLIAQQASLRRWGNTGLVTAARTENKVKIQRWIESAVMTTFHYTGTCKMGEDEHSPVDTTLKLKGIEGLRIADASVIPEIAVSAQNAPSMMIGYRAAEFIMASSGATSVNKRTPKKAKNKRSVEGKVA